MKTTHLYFGSLVCFFLGLVIQSLIYVHWDVAWLISEAQALLSGAHYGERFFDPNPPMILVVYFPIVFLGKLLGIPLAVRVYTFLVGIICWLLCARYTKKSLLLTAIAFCFFVLPTYQFAQREHFILMLTLPYIFSVIVLAEDAPPKPIAFRILVGVLAGIGFSIKPFYLFIPVVTEVYLFFRRKYALFRAENLALVAIVAIYVLFIYFFTREYYSFVLPFLAHFYKHYAVIFRGRLFFTFPMIVMVLSLCLAIVITSKKRKLCRKIAVFTLVMLCEALFFIASGQPWYYHAIPMFAMSLLLLSVLFEKILRISFRFYWAKILCFVLVVAAFLVALIQIFSDFHLFYVLQTSPNYISTNLIQLLKENKKLKSLYAFGVYPSLSAGPALYGDVKNCSRFTGFWMMPVINQDRRRDDLSASEKIRLQQAIQYVRNAVLEDFQRCRPDMVVVDAAQRKAYFLGLPFDYLQFFNEDSRFKRVWQQYCYQQTLNDSYAIYYRCALGASPKRPVRP